MLVYPNLGTIANSLFVAFNNNVIFGCNIGCNNTEDKQNQAGVHRRCCYLLRLHLVLAAGLLFIISYAVHYMFLFEDELLMLGNTDRIISSKVCTSVPVRR
jgi:hypothetical protein